MGPELFVEAQWVVEVQVDSPNAPGDGLKKSSPTTAAS